MSASHKQRIRKVINSIPIGEQFTAMDVYSQFTGHNSPSIQMVNAVLKNSDEVVQLKRHPALYMKV